MSIAWGVEGIEAANNAKIKRLSGRIAALEAENERLVGHIDLLADEFKRIKALHYEKTAHNLEVTGLCERAITNTHQHVPVIKQRDDAEERAILAKAAGKREAAESIREWLTSDVDGESLFGKDSPYDKEYCEKYLTKEKSID